MKTDYKLPQFIEELSLVLKNKNLSIGYPESDDLRIQKAIKFLLEKRIFKRIYTWHETNSNSNLVSNVANDFPHLEDQVFQDQKTKYEKKLKKFNDDILRKNSRSNLMQAGFLLAQDSVDSIVSGCVFTSSDVIRSALKTVGTSEDADTISGPFIMHRGSTGETFLFADCGVVIEPTKNQLVEIAVASTKTWKKLFPDRPPVIAFLSFSTKGSAIHPKAEKIAESCQRFKEKMPDVECEGELQFDAAYDPITGKRKLPGSNLPGRANIFIFPNLNAGNIAYKITQRLAKFEAYGPLLQGLKKPFSDLSRGASWQDIVNISIINALL